MAVPPKQLNEQLSPQVLANIDDLSLMARLAVEGFLSGRHASLNKGYGGEFQQYRQYVPGDDTKYLDWKLAARQDRLCMKVFREETDMRVALVVDATASMAYKGQDSPCSKFHYAAMAAACLAYLARRQGDETALFIYDGNGMSRVRSGEGTSSPSRMAALLASHVPFGSSTLDKALPMVEEYIGGHGMTVIFSDLYDEIPTLGDTLKRLRYGRSDCIVFQILDKDELDLPFGEGTLFVDSETGMEMSTSASVIRKEYCERMEAFSHGLAQNALNANMDYIRMDTMEQLDVVLADYLHKRELTKKK